MKDIAIRQEMTYISKQEWSAEINNSPHCKVYKFIKTNLLWEIHITAIWFKVKLQCNDNRICLGTGPYHMIIFHWNNCVPLFSGQDKRLRISQHLNAQNSPPRERGLLNP